MQLPSGLFACTIVAQVTCVSVPDTPHMVKPRAKLLRRCTIARHELWQEEGTEVYGEAGGTCLLGMQLQQGTVKL